MSRRPGRWLPLLGSMVLALSACQTVEEGYDEELEAIPLEGKADLLDDLPPLTMGKTVTGTLAKAGKPGDRHLFVMALKKGDKFRLTMKATGASLSPDVGLYTAGGSPVASSKWSKPNQKTLQKEYLTSYAGKFVVLVRAYKGQGSGGYSLLASCLGGPCNGEYPPPDALEADDAAVCISKARTCAMAQMQAKGSKLTLTQAKTIWNTCLGQVSLPDGSGCKTACAFQGTDPYSKDAAAELCKTIIDGLVFYSDRSAACLVALSDCWDACTSINGSGYADSFSDTDVFVCLLGGFNGNCDSYARGHGSCGGEKYSSDTWGECCALVSSTDGAWTDDMDTWCQDSCNHEYCDQAVAQCAAGCPGGTKSCIDACLEDAGIWGCY